MDDIIIFSLWLDAFVRNEKKVLSHASLEYTSHIQQANETEVKFDKSVTLCSIPFYLTVTKETTTY